MAARAPRADDDERSPLLPPQQPAAAREEEDLISVVVAQEEAAMAGPSTGLFWRVGCFVGATAVALGAFGAHGLRGYVGDDARRLANWSTAAQYQLIHAGAILLSSSDAPWAAGFFTAGVTMFSGSLYALTLAPEDFSGRKVVGPVTPLGGLCLIAGWVLLGCRRFPHSR